MWLNISNSLIIISAIFTFFSFKDSEFLIFWMNDFFLVQWDYLKLFFQFCFYSFLHWSILHLVFNSLFLYIFWNKVEEYMGKKDYFIFFIFVTILNWISLLILSSWNTIWISWFAMALLAFYTLMLYQVRDNEYKWWITALIINILIWFSAQISLVWHLFWAIFWWIFFYLHKIYKKYF